MTGRHTVEFGLHNLSGIAVPSLERRKSLQPLLRSILELPVEENRGLIVCGEWKTGEGWSGSLLFLNFDSPVFWGRIINRAPRLVDVVFRWEAVSESNDTLIGYIENYMRNR